MPSGYAGAHGDDGDDQESRLLELLAAGASAADIAAVDTDPVLRDLALQVRAVTDLRRRREQELEALVETAQDLATLDDPALVLEAIVLRARTLLGTDLAYLTLHDASAGDTFMRATAGSVSSAFQQLRLELGAGLGGLVASTHRPYWTADYFADDRFRHTSPIDTAVGDEGIVAICGTPLLVKDEFVGVLFAANRSPRTFTADEVALLGSLAALAAVSLVQVGALDTGAPPHRGTGACRAAAHDRFAGIVLRGGGVGEITDACTACSACGSCSSTTRASSAARRPGARDARRGRVRGRGSRRHPYAVDAPLDTAGRLIRTGDRWVVPVAAVDLPLGQLVVGGPDDLDEADRRTVERAAVVTALVLLGERQRADAQLQVRTDLVADLLFGRADLRAVVDAVAHPGRRPALTVLPARRHRAGCRHVAPLARHVGDRRPRAVRPWSPSTAARSWPSVPARRPVGRRRRARPADVRVEPAHRRRLRAGVATRVRSRRPTARRGARHPRSPRSGAPAVAGALPTSGSPVSSSARTPRCATSCARCSARCSTTTPSAAPTSCARRRPTSRPGRARGTRRPHSTCTSTPWRSDCTASASCSAADWQEPGRALQIQLALHLRHLTG